jgi:hypothetical protein
MGAAGPSTATAARRRSRAVPLALGLALASAVSSSRADDVPFGPRTPIATLPGLTVVGVEVADVDGDGDLDAIASSPFTPSFEPGLLAWYPNTDGQGSFGTAQTIAPGRDLDFLAADLDGDGDPDLVEGTLLNSVLWLENAAGDGSSWTQRTIASFGALPGDAADVDGDTDVDIVSTNNGVHWHESDGAMPPTFSTHQFVAPPEPYDHAVAAFFDGDADRDLLAAGHGYQGVPQDPPPILAWLESDDAQPPGFSTHPIDTTGACSLLPVDPSGVLRCTWVRAADVDRDGHTDAVLADGGTLEISWYGNDGGSPPGFTKRSIASNARIGRPADVDGDGDLDVLAEVGGEIVWIESDGGSPPGWTPHSIGPAGAYTRDIEAADLDGDHDLDVVIAAGHEIAWFENQRPPASQVPALPAPARLLVAAALLAAALGAARQRRAPAYGFTTLKGADTASER